MLGGRQLVRTADLSLVVDETDAAAERMATLADSLGGYVASSSARRRNELMYRQMTIRVPAGSFEAALAFARSLSLRVERESGGVEDVTERVIDLDARLRTLRATEEELQALLRESRERQREVEGVMAIYRELIEIRSSIEQIEGQLEGLEELVGLASIQLELVPDEGTRPVVTEAWRPGNTLRFAVRSLLAVLRGLADVAIFTAVVLLPVALLLVGPVLAIRRLSTRSRSS